MKNLMALLVLGACAAVFGRSESSQSSWVTVRNVQIVPHNKAAYIELSASQWGTSVYTVDLSAINRHGPLMLSQIVSSMVSGSQIAFTVGIADSELGGDCRPNGSAIECDYGDRIQQLWLRAP